MAWLERGGALACAGHLIDQGYATPATRGVWGSSAGGIFVGRAVAAIGRP